VLLRIRTTAFDCWVHLHDGKCLNCGSLEGLVGRLGEPGGVRGQLRSPVQSGRVTITPELFDSDGNSASRFSYTPVGQLRPSPPGLRVHDRLVRAM